MIRDATAQRRERTARLAREIMHREAGNPDLDLDRIVRELGEPRRSVQRALQPGFRSQLTAIRMERAARLLASSELPVADIAASCSYSQPGQFAKAFRRFHGTTPSNYREGRR